MDRETREIVATLEQLDRVSEEVAGWAKSVGWRSLQTNAAGFSLAMKIAQLLFLLPA